MFAAPILIDRSMTNYWAGVSGNKNIIKSKMAAKQKEKRTSITTVPAVVATLHGSWFQKRWYPWIQQNKKNSSLHVEDLWEIDYEEIDHSRYHVPLSVQEVQTFHHKHNIGFVLNTKLFCKAAVGIFTVIWVKVLNLVKLSVIWD
jgi:hypothetical protein